GPEKPKSCRPCLPAGRACRQCARGGTGLEQFSLPCRRLPGAAKVGVVQGKMRSAAGVQSGLRARLLKALPNQLGKNAAAFHSGVEIRVVYLAATHLPEQIHDVRLFE